MRHIYKKTKVVCTLGPSSNTPEVIDGLAKAGMNICRMNFSHGTYEDAMKLMAAVRQVNDEAGYDLAIALDTKGPEIRTGNFVNGSEDFVRGDLVTLTKADIPGTHEHFHIQCPELFDDVKAGDSILINDGKMRLSVLESTGTEIHCRVEVDGPISNHKGCNVPGVKLSMPFMSAKDESDLRFGAQNDVDYIFASFIRRPDDILEIRKILEEEGKPYIQIIAKIENQEGYDNLDAILKVADGIMVARGDLGVEIPTEMVPIYQKNMIRKANRIGKPVITATHMLDSMTHNPRCTRAEASDVTNAVLDGSDAVMLSSESAAGEYPIEACQMMSTLCHQAEMIFPYESRLETSKKSARETIQDAIGISVADTALQLDNVAGIIAFTQTGATARRISKFRPCVPILAVTFDKGVQRRLQCYSGIIPVYSDIQNDMMNDDKLANIVARNYGIEAGKYVIITAGYPTGEGSANMMKIVRVTADPIDLGL